MKASLSFDKLVIRDGRYFLISSMFSPCCWGWRPIVFELNLSGRLIPSFCVSNLPFPGNGSVLADYTSIVLLESGKVLSIEKPNEHVTTVYLKGSIPTKDGGCLLTGEISVGNHVWTALPILIKMDPSYRIENCSCFRTREIIFHKIKLGDWFRFEVTRLNLRDENMYVENIRSDLKPKLEYLSLRCSNRLRVNLPLKLCSRYEKASPILIPSLNRPVQFIEKYKFLPVLVLLILLFPFLFSLIAD